jgi:hypothetical protein
MIMQPKRTKHIRNAENAALKSSATISTAQSFRIISSG